MKKKKSKVYDYPIRLFHWVFAILFVTAFFIAEFIDDDSPEYSYHMLVGILMIFLIFLRVIWGFAGTKHSRFSSFNLRLTDLKKYILSILSDNAKKFPGHNPASSYAAIAMFFFTIMLGITGVLMSWDFYKHFFEEVHELMANGFLITAITHVAGVLFHNFKHKDGTIFSMINGQKSIVQEKDEIKSNRPFVALLFIGLFIFFSINLNKSFDKSTQTLNFSGYSIQLGNIDDHKKNRKHK